MQRQPGNKQPVVVGIQHRANLRPLSMDEVRFEVDMCIGCDRWQARLIARDASSNGAGIVQALEERLLEQEYQIERLCAGKSEPQPTCAGSSWPPCPWLHPWRSNHTRL